MQHHIKKYIIIGPARSGTTVTHLILKGHPQVSALNDEVKIIELFGKGISSYTFGNDLREEIDKGFRKAFDLLSLLNASPDTKAAGIKCAVGSAKEAIIFADRIKMSFPDIRIILTVREDILAQFGSLIRAQMTGVYHSWIKKKIKTPLCITVEKARYSRYFLDNIKIIYTLRSLKQTNNIYEILYEKDILNGLNYCKKLYEFLQLDHIEPTWVKSEKVAPSPTEFITNYDKIKLIENEILESQKPIFSLRHFFFNSTKVVFHRIKNLSKRCTRLLLRWAP